MSSPISRTGLAMGIEISKLHAWKFQEGQACPALNVNNRGLAQTACTYPSNKLFLFSLTPGRCRVISMPSFVLGNRFVVLRLSALGEHIACAILMRVVRITTNGMCGDLLLVGKSIGAKRRVGLLVGRSRHDCRVEVVLGDEAVGDNRLYMS